MATKYRFRSVDKKGTIEAGKLIFPGEIKEEPWHPQVTQPLVSVNSNKGRGRKGCIYLCWRTSAEAAAATWKKKQKKTAWLD